MEDKIDNEKIASKENQKISSSQFANSKEQIAREIILKDSGEIEGVGIEGYDFNKGVNYEEIVKSFGVTGFQATHLSKAIGIVNKMIENKSAIYLGCTSNMVSSGLREIIRYLIQHNKINTLVTTGGGIEEDIIKCLGDFKLGSFEDKGKDLREKGINRIGNILVPNSRYIKFEKFIMPVLEELYQKQEETRKAVLPYEIVWKLGEKIDDEKSICYWAWKNKIRIYCPTIMDGSLGDMIYFFKYKEGRENFVIDVAEETKQLNDSTIGLEKSGFIILGGGVIKHSILNAHLYRNGADYAVIINTAHEFDGSDAGASPDEAVSWGKIGEEGDSVKVFGDATILFPLLVAESFAKD